MTLEIPQQKGRIPNWVKTVVPILVSAAILYYYFHDQDWSVLMDALKQAYMPLALAGLVLPQLAFWYLDAIINQRTIVWFHGPLSFRDVFFAKGASYLLGLINNSLSRGGLIVYLTRKANIGVSKLLGIQLFRLGVGLWGLAVYLAVVTAAAQILDVGLEEHVNLWAWWGYVIFNIVWLVEAWFFWHHDVNIGLSRLIVKREREFWSGWNQSKPWHWFYTWAVMEPAFIIVFLSYYLVALSFGIEMPFLKFMVLIPFVLLISNLPVAFGGFGTTTLAWMMFFKGYATEEQIATITLFIPTARVVIRTAVGIFSLPFTIKDLSTLPPKAEEEN